jgi:hypothetical protein
MITLNNMQQNKIYTFKFTSGEEMIAKVTTVWATEGMITVSEPVSVAPGPQGMGLIPSVFTAKNGQPVTINTNNILMIAETEEAIEEKYIEATTGIKLPSKKLIMG